MDGRSRTLWLAAARRIAFLGPVVSMVGVPWIARGQAVQLPVVRQFSAHTTVSVPDGGEISVGGVGRRSESVRSVGPRFPANRGSGLSSSGTGVSVRATIIDLDEWDRAVLGAAPRDDDRRATRESDRLSLAVRNNARDGTPLSASQIEARRNGRIPADPRSAESILGRARKLRAEGKTIAARYAYESALRRAPSSSRAAIARELDELNAASAYWIR
ncbi:MAG: hypothetical protein FJ297_16305 [Planctomycetes bacterium]|nr:hypothetical protein [Planctomycetota bacterium]